MNDNFENDNQDENDNSNTHKDYIEHPTVAESETVADVDEDAKIRNDDSLSEFEKFRRLLDLYEADNDPAHLVYIEMYIFSRSWDTDKIFDESLETLRPRIIAAMKSAVQPVEIENRRYIGYDEIRELREPYETPLMVLAALIDIYGDYQDEALTKKVIDLFHGSQAFVYENPLKENADYWEIWARFSLVSSDVAAEALRKIDSKRAFEIFKSQIYIKIIEHQNQIVRMDDNEAKEKFAIIYDRTHAALKQILKTKHPEALNLVIKLLVTHHYHEAQIMELSDDKGSSGISFAEQASLQLQDAIVSDGVGWKVIIDKLCAELDAQGVQRDDIHPDWLKMVAKAVLRTNFGSDHSEDEALVGEAYNEKYIYPYSDYLVELSATTYAGNPRIGAIIGDLALQAMKRGALLHSIERYEEKNPNGVDAVKTVRIALGSQDAIEPLMKVLQENLDSNFQQVISVLNEQTQERWLQTIRDARIGFYTRMVMSVIVFAVGIFLVLASSWQFLFGNTTSEELFGTGVSFVAGLGTMFAVVYTGPLKEIRKSINDLSSANMSFISYIHRILQISNSYSFLYLKQKIDFDQMGKSSDLLESAMRDTIAMMYINPDNDSFTEHMWKETLRGISNPTPNLSTTAPMPPQNVQSLPQVQPPPEQGYLPPPTAAG